MHLSYYISFYCLIKNKRYLLNPTSQFNFIKYIFKQLFLQAFNSSILDFLKKKHKKMIKYSKFKHTDCILKKIKIERLEFEPITYSVSQF